MKQGCFQNISKNAMNEVGTSARKTESKDNKEKLPSIAFAFRDLPGRNQNDTYIFTSATCLEKPLVLIKTMLKIVAEILDIRFLTINFSCRSFSLRTLDFMDFISLFTCFSKSHMKPSLQDEFDRIKIEKPVKHNIIFIYFMYRGLQAPLTVPSSYLPY